MRSLNYVLDVPPRAKIYDPDGVMNIVVFSRVLTGMDVGYLMFDVMLHRAYFSLEECANRATMVIVVEKDLFSVLRKNGIAFNKDF